MIAGTRDKVGLATILIDARKLRGVSSIKLYLADPELMKMIWTGGESLPNANRELQCPTMKANVASLP